MIYKNERESLDHSGCRYIVVNGSTSAHCCFEATIIDTKEGKDSSGTYWEGDFLEAFELADAVKICNILNFQEK